MHLRAPQFWQKRSFWVRILWPLGCVYALIGLLRRWLTRPKRVRIPVICVGNLAMGGQGKTPVALALADLFKEPAFLTRGYGGMMRGVYHVDSTRHLPSEVGEEALLLAEKAPTWVCENRYDGALKAQESGAKVVIMDDGFQNPTLYKDISFLVIDGSYGFGNHYVFPAGPLREPASWGTQRADALIIIGDTAPALDEYLSRVFHGKGPIFRARLVIDPEHALDHLKAEPVLAFAGIGLPNKFFNFLEAQGFTVIEDYDFPDHHTYTQKDLEKIMGRAQSLAVRVVTTAKDFIKLPVAMQNQVTPVKINVQFDDPASLEKWLREKVSSAEKNP